MHTHQDKIPPPGIHAPNKLLLRGIDSLYVSFYLDTATCSIDWEDLAYRKERVRTEGNDFAELSLGSESFALLPYGKKPYRYVLTNRAFEVRLGERMQPACHVQFFSEALWSDGPDALETRLRDWCASLGLTHIQREVISRADWAFDYHLPIIDFDASSFVSRATKDATHREHGKPQTFRMGQGEVVVRVYDKSTEIEQQSGKAWFFDLWGRKDQVWRIEFQVRGERLKQAGIRTFADMRDLQHDLLRELAENHTTLRAKTSDSNRSRWPLHPLWQQLSADIARMPQLGMVRAIDPESSLAWRQAKQLKALYGSLKGLSAVRSLITGKDQPIALEEMLRVLPRLLVRDHTDTLWRADIEHRMTAYRYGKW